MLDRATERKTVTVFGGAGYGKTTLIDQWSRRLGASGVSVVRASIGLSSSSDSVESQLVSAFAAVGIVPGNRSQGCHAHLWQIADVLGAVGDQCGQVLLVIDEVHRLTHRTDIATVQHILDESPANLRVALVGRAAPLLSPGAALRISAPDLAFDVDETAHFLVAVSSAPLSRTQVRRVRNVIDGWPAGLRLLWQAPDATVRDALVAYGTDFTPLRSYILDNILSDLDPGQQRFLAILALVPRFCAPLAIVLTGCPEAAQWIESLDRLHLFIIRRTVDDEEPWFSIHSAFVDTLQSANVLDGAERIACHQRAIDWFIREGHLLDALDQICVVPGMSLPASLADAPMSLRSFSQLGKVAAHFRGKASTTIGFDPRILAIIAWSFLLTSDLEEASRWLSRLEGSGDPRVETQRRALAAGIALSGDRLDAVWDAVGAVQVESINDPFVRQNLASQIVTVLQFRGEHETADRLLDRIYYDHRHEKGEMAIILRALKIAGFTSRGMMRAAVGHGTRVLEIAEKSAGTTSVSAAIAAAYVAEARYALNQPALAREILSDRWRLLRYSPPDPLMRAVLTHVRVISRERGGSAALPLIAEALSWFEARGLYRGQAKLLHERLRIELISGRREMAGRTLDQLSALADSSPLLSAAGRELAGFLKIMRARIALEDGAPLDALGHLKFFDHSGAQLEVYLRTLVSLLRARSYLARHRITDAMIAVRPAVEAAQDGVLSVTLDEAGELGPVLLENAKSLDLPRDLSDALRLSAESSKSVFVQGRTYEAVGTNLTPREKDIAKLVAKACSNKRIAAELGISPATVKWNLDNIRRKMNVISRYDIAKYYHN